MRDDKTSPGSEGQPDERSDVAGQLYRRYGRGGTLLSSLRGATCFLFKKYGWILATESAYFFKRVMDIVGSAVLLVPFSPVFLLTAPAIKREDDVCKSTTWLKIVR